jgi:citrate lyase gamma subunit
MKKLFITFLVLLTLAASLLTGCSAVFRTTDKGPLLDKTYDFTNFTNVQISSAFKYEIKQGAAYGVDISTYQYLIDRLDVYQSGNTVYIGFKSNTLTFNVNENATVTITMPALNELTVSGASNGTVTGFDSDNALDIALAGASRMDTDIKSGKTNIVVSGASGITGSLTSSDTQITLSGASDLNMTMQTGNSIFMAFGSSDIRGTLQSQDCRVTLSGASTCRLTGAADNTVLDASGSSDFDSPGFTAQTADVTLTGASSASILVKTNLNVNISGSSTLNYYGNPTIGKTSVTGASDLNHK